MEPYNIDLRSDTVTKPTNEMLTTIFSSKVGDDVFEEDPTVQLLQTTIAQFFGKENALFFPSGTMSNLTSILCWCDKRGSEIIVGNNSHIFLFEQGGASQFGGVSLHCIPNLDDGTMILEDIRNAIRDDDIHEPTTRLIAIENTHNACGGKILPREFLINIKELALEYNLPIHLDGARIWNALQESEMDAIEMGSYVDSISVCLSKGLGAPIGSLLVGSNELIKKAKRIRKALGGGMRQSGIVASAGLVGFHDFLNNIIAIDHENMKILANIIKDLPGFIIQEEVQTNILFIHIHSDIHDEQSISLLLKNKNILVSAWSKNLIRVVVHRNISRPEIEYVGAIFKEISMLLVIC